MVLISCSSRCDILKVLLVALYVLLFLTCNCEADPRSVVCPNTTTYYTKNSTFQRNLDNLLSTLSNNSRNKLFYNATAGDTAPDRVYGLFLCRGDVTNDVCHDCVERAAKDAVTLCPKDKSVNMRYDLCMLRYDNTSFFSIMDAGLTVYSANPKNVTDPDRFSKILEGVMNSLATRVSSGLSNKESDGQMTGFGTNETKTSFQNLYSLIQCTPDLSESDCDRCFRAAISFLPNCCAGKQGGRVMLPSCNIRYDVSPFYNSIAAPPSPTPQSTPPAPRSCPASEENGGISAHVTISIVVVVVVSVLLFITLVFCFLRRRAKKYDVVVLETIGIGGIEMTIAESLQYDLSTIRAATNNFSAENKIGKGGFGDVFKGKLSNGQEIAVKRLFRSSGQGAQEFKNEVVLVSELKHRNLVRLVGFCIDREENILIYEFVPNKSLDHFLFDPKKQRLLDWTTRYKIIRGVAQGILYLHEDSHLKIIHRDLTASNILLDEDMNPKISDFGIAKIFQFDESQGNTSRIVGTFGYMSPEYARYGEFSAKSDVFSFGVLLLEIISGKKNSSFIQSGGWEDLLTHAWKLWRDGTPLDLVDPALGDSFVKYEVVRCIHIGLLCVQEIADERPTMASVILMLNSHTFTLAVPHRPAFFVSRRIDTIAKALGSVEFSSKSLPWSANKVSITEL